MELAMCVILLIYITLAGGVLTDTVNNKPSVALEIVLTTIITELNCILYASGD